MAIAGILLTVPLNFQYEVCQALNNYKEVVMVNVTPANAQIPGVALVVECPGQKLSKIMEDLAKISGVLDAGLTFADYADDEESAG